MKRRGDFHLYIPSEHRKDWASFIDFCQNSGKSASRTALQIIMANWQDPKKRSRPENMRESRAPLMNKNPEDF